MPTEVIRKWTVEAKGIGNLECGVRNACPTETQWRWEEFEIWSKEFGLRNFFNAMHWVFRRGQRSKKNFGSFNENWFFRRFLFYSSAKTCPPYFGRFGRTFSAAEDQREK